MSGNSEQTIGRFEKEGALVRQYCDDIPIASGFRAPCDFVEKIQLAGGEEEHSCLLEEDVVDCLGIGGQGCTSTQITLRRKLGQRLQGRRTRRGFEGGADK